MAIPKPADELLAPIPSSSSKLPPQAKTTTKKGTKSMVPNNSTSAR